MDDLETECLSLLDFDIPIFYRYVDDIFTIVSKTRVDDLLAVFNNYHPQLKFTHEIETNLSLNFLNTTIIKDNKLITNWYRKSTCSGRYINYFSNYSHNYKINTVTCLVDHAILLSDDVFTVTT